MSGETTMEVHARIRARAGSASWHELWAAVDNVLNEHRPVEGQSIDTLNCPAHHVSENIEGHLAALRESRDSRGTSVFEDCPDCVITPYSACSSAHCIDGWPCEPVGAILGALGEAG